MRKLSHGKDNNLPCYVHGRQRKKNVGTANISWLALDVCNGSAAHYILYVSAAAYLTLSC